MLAEAQAYEQAFQVPRYLAALRASLPEAAPSEAGRTAGAVISNALEPDRLKERLG